MTPAVAIIGAGIAGLSCARELTASDVPVRLFDKGRKPGGRVTTRRLDGVAFDDGAQYATARDPGFLAWLQAAAAGHAAPWDAATDGDAAADGPDTRWVGVPGMSALPGALARALPDPVSTGRHAAFLHRDTTGWWVRHMPAETIAPGAVADAGGDLAGPFATVLLAMPAPQAAVLLRTTGHPFADLADRARYAPCWAATIAFADRIEAADIQRPVQRPGAGPLRWIAREASRPGRPALPDVALPDAWVVHASAAWSRDNLEREPAAVAVALLAAFQQRTDAPEPLLLAARRWRYALVETPLGEDCLWDPVAGLGACGDWCLAGRVEAAFVSGRALARRVLGIP